MCVRNGVADKGATLGQFDTRSFRGVFLTYLDVKKVEQQGDDGCVREVCRRTVVVCFCGGVREGRKKAAQRSGCWMMDACEYYLGNENTVGGSNDAGLLNSIPC